MLRVILATAKKNYIVNRIAYPWSMTVGRLVAAGYTVFFAYFVYFYLAKNRIDSSFVVYSGTADYLSYVIIGSAFYTFAKSILMGVGRAPMLEVREGTIENIFVSPCSRIGYLLGQLLEQFLRAILEMGVVTLLGILMGMRFKNINILHFFVVLIVSTFSLFSMSIAISSLMMYMRDTFITQNTIFHLMALLCGVSFPPEYLPGFLAYVGRLIPFTDALSIMRAVLIGSCVEREKIVWVLILSLIYLVIGLKFLKKSEYLLNESLFA